MALPTSRVSDKFMLRLPDGLRGKIKTAAETNGRSMNAEIVKALQEAYEPVRISRTDVFSFLDLDLADIASIERLIAGLRRIKESD